jgi:hypothetical protein
LKKLKNKKEEKFNNQKSKKKRTEKLNLGTCNVKHTNLDSWQPKENDEKPKLTKNFEISNVKQCKFAKTTKKQHFCENAEKVPIDNQRRIIDRMSVRSTKKMKINLPKSS